MGHYVSNGLSDYGNLTVLCSQEARWHLPRTHSHLQRDTQKTSTTCQINRKEAMVGRYLNTLICVVNTLDIWYTCLSRSIMLQHAFWKVEPVSVYLWTWDGIIKIHVVFIKKNIYEKTLTWLALLCLQVIKNPVLNGLYINYFFISFLLPLSKGWSLSLSFRCRVASNDSN